MVVWTLLWPGRDWTVRMSEPPSRRWVARECRLFRSRRKRHSFATYLLGKVLGNGADIRTVQELLGHKSVATALIYAHVLGRGGVGARSPLDSVGITARAESLTQRGFRRPARRGGREAPDEPHRDGDPACEVYAISVPWNDTRRAVRAATVSRRPDVPAGHRHGADRTGLGCGFGARPPQNGSQGSCTRSTP
jgi:hypothetical protein